jgi:gluconolactonase
MARTVETNSRPGFVSRRGLLQATAGMTVMGPALAFGQQAKLGTPPSVTTTPARQWGRGAAPEIYPDPDIIVIDDSFNNYLLGITAIHRVWTGGLWAEGPAWSSQGQYLVFSDVQANLQHRFMWDSRSTATFRAPSNNSNGNSFDFQGRQLSTEDLFRRVIRWENDGSMTVIADSFDGKKLNSPNDLVPHPDGSIWFTDPYYGDSLSEGHPDVAGGASNPDGLLNPRLGASNADLLGGQKRELPASVYRWDPSGRVDQVLSEDRLPDPNGICFSPDHKTVYICSTGKGPGESGPGGKNVIYAADVQGQKLGNLRQFTDMMVDGVHCGPDGLRADVFGNLWCSSNAPLGYAGVVVYSP